MLEGLAVALSNIDAIVEQIKNSANAGEAREKLMAQPWKSDTVVRMLEKAGPDAAKPEDLDEAFGLKDNGDTIFCPRNRHRPSSICA